MKTLEKWYVWDNCIDPRTTKFFLSNGWTMQAGDILIIKVLRPDFDTNIVAYTLGEQVESKRVVCLGCGGKGVVNTQSIKDMRNIFVQCKCKRGAK
jgi:hypothetical protein